MPEIISSIVNEIVPKIIEKTTQAIEQSLVDVKADVLVQKKAQFGESRGANEWDDEEFPQIKESTIRDRKKKFGVDDDIPLVVTGRLRDSIREEDDLYDLSVKSDVEYAPYAENWAEKEGQGRGHHPFLKLTDKEMERATELLVKEIKEKLSGIQNE